MSISAVLTRSSTRNLSAFLRLTPDAKPFTSIHDLSRFDEWDCAVIAIDTEHLASVSEILGSIGKPILIEKPGATSASQLRHLQASVNSAYLGYNRRFFRSVNSFRESLQMAPQVRLEVDVPEAIFDEYGDPKFIDRLTTNAVHQIDLVRFIVGEIASWGLTSYPSGFPLPEVHFEGQSVQGHPVSIHFRWNAAALTRFSFDWKGGVYELSPMETLTVRIGLNVDARRAAEGIRTYSPQVAFQISEDAGQFKPGFLQQMAAFRDAVMYPNQQSSLASLTDGCRALEIAESIINHLGGE